MNHRLIFCSKSLTSSFVVLYRLWFRYFLDQLLAGYCWGSCSGCCSGSHSSHSSYSSHSSASGYICPKYICFYRVCFQPIPDTQDRQTMKMGHNLFRSFIISVCFVIINLLDLPIQIKNKNLRNFLFKFKKNIFFRLMCK